MATKVNDTAEPKSKAPRRNPPRGAQQKDEDDDFVPKKRTRKQPAKDSQAETVAGRGNTRGKAAFVEDKSDAQEGSPPEDEFRAPWVGAETQSRDLLLLTWQWDMNLWKYPLEIASVGFMLLC